MFRKNIFKNKTVGNTFIKRCLNSIKKNKLNVFLIFSLLGLYLLTHLVSLTKLPVFADESIYIRWTQLIIDDWKRFLFFAMNDGKTPFFIWVMVPFQFIFKNQLFAGRFVAVLVGLLQVILNMNILKSLGARKKSQIFVGLLTTILPFWYFHHRMALMDGMLTLFVSITLLNLIKVVKNKKTTLKENLGLLIVAGISFGLAMLTKIPAVLFVPSFYLLIFLGDENDSENLKDLNVMLKLGVQVSISVFIGLLIFASLKIHPVFGQLFSRGSDFLYPLSEIITGKWTQTIINFPNYIGYFIFYLTPGVAIFSLIGLFSKRHKKTVHVLFWSGIIFLFPIAIMGKTVYPRYLFPASLFFTLSAVMGLESLLISIFENKNKLWKKSLIGVIVSLLIANTITSSLNYIHFSVTDADKTPFISSDRLQYLTEWSSGHGMVETINLIQNQAKSNTVAIATEGYFGTLPDALLMYLHGTDLSNIYLEGIGQPVGGIPESFAIRAESFDKKWLVVNSHRMNMKIDSKYLIAEYCRPFNAPCLQVWDLTEEFDTYIDIRSK